MIDEIVIEIIDSFIRENYGSFSVQTIKRHLVSYNIADKNIDIESYLKSHPYVFSLEKNEFISRSSVFTNAYFCIKPTAFEISQGILIPGHRCMPFVDPEMYPHELMLCFERNPLKQIPVKIPLADVIDASMLYGEEYIPQLLSVDPANKDYDFVKNDYVLPNTVDITVWDVKKLFATHKVKHGDRLLARVVNWSTGLIDFTIQSANKESPFEVTKEDEMRDAWFSEMDNAIIKAISNYGPLSSIEEQLAYTYFSNKVSLCTEFCCSTEEYMQKENSISIEYYGVESRLWTKGDEIPAIGSWSEGLKDTDDLVNTLYEEIGIPIPFYMLDAYIFDSLYRKEVGVKGIYKRIIPDIGMLDAEHEARFLSHIQERYEKLGKSYNRFLDFEKGEIRSRSLELYSELVQLICTLDTCGLPVAALPQQQLVIVSQLFSHTTKFLEAFMTDSNLSRDDITMISTSLDGMVDSFEEVSSELTFAMGKKNKDGFTII